MAWINRIQIKNQPNRQMVPMVVMGALGFGIFWNIFLFLTYDDFFSKWSALETSLIPNQILISWYQNPPLSKNGRVRNQSQSLILHKVLFQVACVSHRVSKCPSITQILFRSDMHNDLSIIYRDVAILTFLNLMTFFGPLQQKFW